MFTLLLIALTVRGVDAEPAGTPRLSLALLPLDASGGIPGGSLWLDDALVNQFITLDRFRVVERAKIERLLAELRLGPSGLADPKTAARLGRIVAADLVVAGSLQMGGKTASMAARLIDTETAEIYSAHQFAAEATDSTGLIRLFHRLAALVRDDFPLVKGVVIKADDHDFLVDIGRDQGLRKGARLLLWASDGSARDRPASIEARVTEVREAFARAVLLREASAPKVMDPVRTK